MSWTYQQSTGKLSHPDLGVVAVGFSGYDDGDGIREPGEGKNDPSTEYIKSVGPIPHGRYCIGAPVHHPKCGPFSMPLTPMPGTDTKDRGGFWMHGGKVSLGCVLLLRLVRWAIWGSGDHELEVIP